MGFKLYPPTLPQAESDNNNATIPSFFILMLHNLVILSKRNTNRDARGSLKDLIITLFQGFACYLFQTLDLA